MASSLPNVSHCQICFEETKYICITCGIPICNKCGIPELDEDVRGWLASRSVGYCTVDCLQPPKINDTSGSQDILPRKDSDMVYSVDEDDDPSNDEEDLRGKSQKKNGNKLKKKAGRKAQWPESLIGDMVDIIVSTEYLRNKLIFQNCKNQKNSDVYQKVLNQLRKRAERTGEDVPFNAVQLRTKFKKLVSECKKAALLMKTASGIKRFQEEHGYGPWFNQLFALVKTRDSCQPEQAIEPSAQGSETSSMQSQRPSPERSPQTDLTGSVESSPEFFVPVKQSKKAKENMLQEVVGMLKKVVQQDPMKGFLEFAREEADKARRHELQLVQLMMSQNQQPVNATQPRQQLSFNNYLQNDNNEDLQYYQL